MCLLFVLSIIVLISWCLNIDLVGKGADFHSSENQSSATEPLILSTFNLEDPLPEVPVNMMVYQTVDPLVTEEDIILLMEAFDLSGEIADREKHFVVKEGSILVKAFDREYGTNYRILEVFKQPGTGYIRFSDTAMLGREGLEP